MEIDSYDTRLQSVLEKGPDGKPELQNLCEDIAEECRISLDAIAIRDAIAVEVACKGVISINNDLLINVVCNRTKSQIGKIDVAANKMFPDTTARGYLSKKLEKAISGNYGRFLQYYSEQLPVFHYHMLRTAMDGLGSNKDLLDDLFCILSNAQIQEMRETFEKGSDSKLGDRLKSELSGKHEELILRILYRGKGENPADDEKAISQAEEVFNIIKEGKGMVMGLKSEAESKLIEIFVDNSSAQLKAIAREYEKAHPDEYSLEKTIMSKCSRQCNEAMMCLTRTPLEHWCVRLRESTDGLGSSDKKIARVFGGLDKCDAVPLVKTYQHKYSTDLASMLKTEIGGSFLSAITTYLEGNDPTGGLEPWLVRVPLEGYTLEQLEQRARVLLTCLQNIKVAFADMDADMLKVASEGITNNQRLVVKTLCPRNKAQLERIDTTYRKRFNTDLHSLVSGIVSNDNIKELLQYAVMAEKEFDVYALNEALKVLQGQQNKMLGFATFKEELVVVEVLCTRSWPRLHTAVNYYKDRYDHSIKDDIRAHMYPPLATLCLKLAEGARGIAEQGSGRNSTDDIDQLADALAEHLSSANADGVSDIFVTHSLSEMKDVAFAFERRHSKSLELAIRETFNNQDEQAGLVLAYVSLMHTPADFFARRLKEGLEGFFADKHVFNRILAGNDKAQMKEICAEFSRKYDTEVSNVVQKHLSGDYRTAVLAWIGSEELTQELEAEDQNGQGFAPPPLPPAPPAPPVPPAAV